jgi:competence protein ComEA
VSDLLLRFKWPIVASLCAVAVVSCILLARDRLDDPTQLVVNSADEAPADIRVYVTGAVQRPGVYPLSSNARWIDALEAAGGATADADLTAVNLSLRVKDEDQIVVPQLGQSPALLVAGAASTPSLININLADQEELESLPGIGEVRASRIIASREAEGPFTQPEDLLLRDIVPDSVYEDIEPLITVN